tara:strand:- start:6868 stop:8064 length:1197 start_codon:yes stop_codon:yes gene_type:complete
MRNETPKLFIKIDIKEILIVSGYIDEYDNFKILKNLAIPIEGIIDKKIVNLEKVTHLIKSNILLIEKENNFTFKDFILVLNNFDISFLNLTGYQKLNGTQISRENITYILNSLKSYIDEFEFKKKIIHIFNTKFFLDKKKIDNLPVGLFGDFYSHELSFNLISKNDFKNLNNIFSNCNLQIKKILLEGFVKTSLICNMFPEIDIFYYIQFKKNNCKISFIENGSLKYEQTFEFGTDIIFQDISKITSLNKDFIKEIIKENPDIENLPEDELVENKYFDNQVYRKIKKKLFFDIAESRIQELSDILCHKNINFEKSKTNLNSIFLEINNNERFQGLDKIIKKCFTRGQNINVKIIEDFNIEKTLDNAFKITQFGWQKEVIPVTEKSKSLISRLFHRIFH